MKVPALQQRCSRCRWKLFRRHCCRTEDFLSAVFVNGNGTRNTVPVSRQLFKDGSVGLFNGGGTVDVPSPNGPIQISLVEPGSIPNKTIIKAEYVAPTNYPATVTNTPPENGKLVGAFKFSGRGDEVTQGIDISFPVKVQDLNLPPDLDPTNASFAGHRSTNTRSDYR